MHLLIFINIYLFKSNFVFLIIFYDKRACPFDISVFQQVVKNMGLKTKLFRRKRVGTIS